MKGMGRADGSPVVASRVVLMFNGKLAHDDIIGLQSRLSMSGLILSKGEQLTFEGRNMFVVETEPESTVKLEKTTKISLLPQINIDEEEEKLYDKLSDRNMTDKEPCISPKNVEFDG
ncbi:MAG: hypothetical protein QXT63_04100 [Thermoplasmata archaeon]